MRATEHRTQRKLIYSGWSLATYTAHRWHNIIWILLQDIDRTAAHAIRELPFSQPRRIEERKQFQYNTHTHTLKC